MRWVHWCKPTQANLIINDIKNVLQITPSGQHRLQPKPILCRNGCLDMEIVSIHPLPAQNVSLLNCTFAYLAYASLSTQKSLSDPLARRGSSSLPDGSFIYALDISQAPQAGCAWRNTQAVSIVTIITTSFCRYFCSIRSWDIIGTKNPNKKNP